MKTMAEDGVHVIMTPPYEAGEILRFPGMPGQVWEIINDGDGAAVEHAGMAQGGDKASFRIGTQIRLTELDGEHAHLRAYLYRQEFDRGKFGYINAPEEGWVDPRT